MRLHERQLQLARIEVFANVGQLLFQLQQSIRNMLLVSKCDVAPHRIWTGGDAGHLTQRASAGFDQWGARAVFVNQSYGERSRYHLGNVADPGTELIVISGIEFLDASTDLFYQACERSSFFAV